ncbi:YbaK/EbsC family protein [uncultured Fusobacterium sp.]|uniref:YbaK/EbsC family protein n=1 Tax=uncultured Fusobacterium sp. TaxID=159267 RepID=UPI0025F334A7|nr:YbaK/EbsC family protein [uncultured Fusobacterium sp.]
MSLESVKKYFIDNNLPLTVEESSKDTTTVKLAAEAFGILEDEIAKTMGYKLKNGEYILILTKGTARLDNRKFKDIFHEKAVMIPADEVFEATGHPVGGVCPFGLKSPLKIYLDESLKEFNTVYPAGGSPHSAVKISLDMLADITKGEWVNVTKE